MVSQTPEKVCKLNKRSTDSPALRWAGRPRRLADFTAGECERSSTQMWDKSSPGGQMTRSAKADKSLGSLLLRRGKGMHYVNGRLGQALVCALVPRARFCLKELRHFFFFLGHMVPFLYLLSPCCKFHAMNAFFISLSCCSGNTSAQ